MHWFGGGTLESANSKFQNPAAQASAHYGISKGRVWQWVKETDAAWHCGVPAVNIESIGIEHDATIYHKLSEEDYRLSAELLADISKRYNLPLNRQTVIKHSEVKATQCCGTVDIDRIINMANELLKPKPMNILWTRLLLANNVEPEKRPLYEQEIADADEWYDLMSGGKFKVKTEILYVNHNNIPMGDYGALTPDGKVRVMAPAVDWFDKNVTRVAQERGGYDEVGFYEEATDAIWIIPEQVGKSSETIQGLMFFNSPVYPRMQRTMVQADLGQKFTIQGYHKQLGLATIITMHETSHAIFWLYTNAQGVIDDPTHALFYTENMKDTHKIFERIDYEKLNAALKVRRGTPATPPQTDMKFLRINQGGKQGIIVSEDLAGTVLFEDKWGEYQTLLQITNGMSLNHPVVNIPAGKFFRVRDGGKLGIMVLEGFSGTLLWESAWTDYQTLLAISGMSMSTPEIVFP